MGQRFFCGETKAQNVHGAPVDAWRLLSNRLRSSHPILKYGLICTTKLLCSSNTIWDGFVAPGNL
jgi:hypothetical protein